MHFRYLLPCLLLTFLSVSLAAAFDLPNELDRTFADSSLRDADVGVLVQVLDGDVLYQREPDQLLIPASNMKLVTAATALRTWGDLSHLPAAMYADAFQVSKPDSRLAPESVLALLRGMDKVSDNDMAESFLRALLETHGLTNYNDLARSAWEHLNLPLTGCAFVDGSGLSRGNRLTPRFLVALLQYMRLKSEYAGAFVHTLPIAGVDGTLQTRMRGSCAEGCVRAKTGSLTGVSTLSGYVDRSGRRVVFSIMMNNYTVNTQVMREIQNRACMAIAQWCAQPNSESASQRTP